MNLCKYKNILGESGKGVHSYRIFNIAVFDVLATVLGAFFISRACKLPFGYTLLFLFLLGIFLHKIFCVKTTVGKFIFG
jgi:hypothetical protein